MRVDLKASPRVKRKRAAKRDVLLQRLRAMPPDELEAWIDGHVNNMAQAKVLLKCLALEVLGGGDE